MIASEYCFDGKSMVEKNLPMEKVSKTVSRLYAVQALFQMESGDIALEKVKLEFENYHDQENNKFNNFVKADLELFRQILDHTIKHQIFIDQSIGILLKSGWAIDRIDPILRSIFRAASGEFLLETPPKVVINEFLDIAKAFFPTGREYLLVNGILDSLAKKNLRKELSPNSL